MNYPLPPVWNQRLYEPDRLPSPPDFSRVVDEVIPSEVLFIDTDMPSQAEWNHINEWALRLRERERERQKAEAERKP